ncbi:hypothetical protein Poly41_19860 [Novipirellula artificiosorum]|uniref:Uncharacterized protein n=1 Tax=Novipirellula artificiosorum TaxID=2528016 RepID=A0A5C6DWW6_9BACT|nr:hypothetical protein Poly41_19860 [Novipirellula artificiosorum]
MQTGFHGGEFLLAKNRQSIDQRGRRNRLFRLAEFFLLGELG